MSPTILEPPYRHDTGEQPAVITEKVRFSWPILTAVVAIAVTAAGGIAMAKGASECCSTATTSLHAHELRIQRTEDAQTAGAEALREIKSELKEINRKLDENRRPHP